MTSTQSMHDADSMLLIPAMERAIRCLVLLLGVAGFSCASDYTERFRLAHPGWTPAPPVSGDSVEETLASIHAGPGAPLEVSVRELRVLRVDVEPWEVLEPDSVVAGPEEQTLGMIAHRRCKGRRGIQFLGSERVSWYVFVAGELVSYDHFEFDADCEPENHYAPSGAEHLATERALVRYAASAYPESVPTTAERISKGMALVSADRLPDAERMLRHADRELDFMAAERETLPEEERAPFEAEEERLRAMRAKLSRAIAAARRQPVKPSD
jgi:hypothetical protein